MRWAHKLEYEFLINALNGLANCMISLANANNFHSIFQDELNELRKVAKKVQKRISELKDEMTKNEEVIV